MNECLLVKIPPTPYTPYPIFIENDLLLHLTRWLPDNFNNIVIITDHTVKKLYGNKLATQLKKQKKNITLLSFAPGEKSKNNKTKQILEEHMLKKLYNRDTLILALGGGVVGDLAGFIAATYMRGIAFIQIPTTLLAMVDSSVGGKTGIDTQYGKNLIGAFWQPKTVVSDIQCLKSLPKKHIIQGLIESLKMFLTSDAKSFYYLCQHLNSVLSLNSPEINEVIYHSVKIKAHVVAEDEKENNLRMILNFGHTIGHALEYITTYKMLHGYAVAYGILVEAKIAMLMGALQSQHFDLIQQTLAQLGFQTKDLKKYNIAKIIQATKIDKKAHSNQVRYILLSDIGRVHKENKIVAHPVADKIVKQAYLELIKDE